MAVNGGKTIEQCMTLLAEMEEMMSSAKKYIFASEQCIINKNQMNERLELLRTSLPDAMPNAARIVAEEEEILKKAQEESLKMTSDANLKADQIVADAKIQLKEMEKQIAELQKETEKIQGDNERLRQEGIQRAEAEGNSIVKNAQQQANQMRAMAEQRAQELVTQENIYHMAETRANEIVDAANKEAGNVRQSAFNYLEDVLTQAEQYLAGMAGDVHRERENLNSHR